MNRFAKYSKPLTWLLMLAVAALVAGCGGKGTSTNAGSGSGPNGRACNCVPLGTAIGYAILAKTGITSLPSSVVTGNVGLSPASRGDLKGWLETVAPDSTYSTSTQIVAPSNLYAADYAAPTPANLTTAVLNMETAYADAAARVPTSAATTDIGTPPGTLVNMTLASGVYQWGSAVNIPTDLTFDGSGKDFWVLKVSGPLFMAAGKKIILINGAQSRNIYWQVSDDVTIGANAQFAGIILGKKSITFGNLASINGRLLAQSMVTLNAATVTQPPRKVQETLA